MYHITQRAGDGEPCLTARWIERDVNGKSEDKALAAYNKSLIEVIMYPSILSYQAESIDWCSGEVQHSF